MTIKIKKILLQRKLLLVILASFIIIQIIVGSVFPYLTKFIIDEVLIQHQLRQLKLIMLLAVALISIQIPVNVAVSYLCSKWSQLVIFDLRMAICKIFLHNKENSKKNGLFINTITSDCELVGNQLLNITINSLPNALLVIVYLAILIRLNALLSCVTLAIIPLFLLIAYITSKKVFVLTKELQHYRDKLIEFLNSHTRNKLLIDLYRLRTEEQQKFLTVANQVKDVNVKTNTILSFLNNLSGLIAVVTPLLTLFVGSVFVLNNKLSIGSLIAFNSYTSLLFSPLSKMLNIPPMYSQMKASIERIEIAKFSEQIFKKGSYRKKILPKCQQINVDEVIPYINDTALLTSDLNFSVKEGELLQITGSNGSGKSILLKCLINYHENFTGSINVKQGIKIIYIPQESFLFEGTIKDNLIKGLTKYDSDYLEFLIELLKFDLPMNKEVTSFSLNLSSGQLQKIKLIRALLDKPDVLLLDEVFANLDNVTTSNLLNYLNKIGMTTVFVYHGDMTQLSQRIDYKVLNLESYSSTSGSS